VPTAAGSPDEGAGGWRALLGRKYPEDQPETFVFCPDCTEREFALDASVPFGRAGTGT
jgi:hypothetical protein